MSATTNEPPALFQTIDGTAWKRSLPKARARVIDNRATRQALILKAHAKIVKKQLTELSEK